MLSRAEVEAMRDQAAKWNLDEIMRADERHFTMNDGVIALAAALVEAMEMLADNHRYSLHPKLADDCNTCRRIAAWEGKP